MIVECAGCNTRFRLADEKVRVTGTKVRCSRCGATFVVKPSSASLSLDEPSFDALPTRVAPPPNGLLAETERTAPLPEPQPTARWALTPAPPPAAPAPRAADPVPWAATPGPPKRESSPWSLGPSAPAAAPEPGSWQLTPAPPPPAPSAVKTPVPADDWLPPPLPVAPAAPKPPEPAIHRWGSPSPAATSSIGPDALADLSFTDLHFGNTRVPVAPEPDADLHFGDTGVPAAPPLPPSVPLPDVPPLADDPLDLLGTPAAPVPLDRFSPGPSLLDGPSLDLSAPSPPRPATPAPGIELATGSWGPSPQAAAFEKPSGLELGTGSWSFDQDQALPGTFEQPVRPAPAPPLSQGRPVHAQPIGRTRPPQRAAKRSRPLLRMLSGAAVLATALVVFVTLRSGGGLPRDVGQVLAAFGFGEDTGPAVGTELRPEGVQTGRYSTVSGRDVFYVRGEVRSHADEMRGPAVRVKAELVDGDRVVASGAAWAGGEPTAEQVHGLRGAGGWSDLAERLGTRWARPIAPGGSAPFFVVLPVPEGEGEVRLRVVASAADRPGDPAAVAAD